MSGSEAQFTSIIEMLPLSKIATYQPTYLTLFLIFSASVTTSITSYNKVI
ncbi:hypothetical protein HMPREF9706_00305 [Facklamia hominis CCUG 36813]|uniref:Uncharacterized protein n=1 Tax=Facklamia hominis CCUG 36813 TaxID=883111 RepID=K1LW04_9LACT|nr:hypothetical protein HMPREF9706_00305 [Facklamia hominis CCUG 36813]